MAIDWLERVDEDYIVVTMLPRRTSSSGASLLGDSPYKSENSRKASRDVSVLSIEGVSRDSPILTEKECILRVGTLQHCASAVNEVVKEEVNSMTVFKAGFSFVVRDFLDVFFHYTNFDMFDCWLLGVSI